MIIVNTNRKEWEEVGNDLVTVTMTEIASYAKKLQKNELASKLLLHIMIARIQQ